MSEDVKPEELVSAYRSTAYQVKKAQRVQTNIQESGFVKRAISGLKGETEAAQKAADEAKAKYETTVNVPKEQVDAIQGGVNEVLATRTVYEGERERIIKEVAPQYKKQVESMDWPGKTADEEGYVDDFESLKAQGEDIPAATLAKALAVRDVFYPKVDNPGYAGMTFMIGEDIIGRTELAIHNGQRFPRFEIGSDKAEDAVSVASANGWGKVVKTSVAVTGDTAPESGEKPSVLGEKSVYTAVSDETAALLDLAMPEMGRSSSLYEAFGRRQGMSTGTATHIEFSTLSVDELNAVAPQSA